MSTQGWSGPYLFVAESIDLFVTEKSPGNFALGLLDSNGSFVIGYTFRSDTDLAAELRTQMHLFGSTYTHFIHCYTQSARAAFEMDCMLFHKLVESDHLISKIHPSQPDGVEFGCPVCE